jgi:redox-sensitive bicupin YhaK (pirin superfamily)
VAPDFEHHATLPGFTSDGVTTTVLMGSVADASSPGTAYSPLVGADLKLTPGADVELPLEPDFEYAVLAAGGSATIEDAPVEHGSMLYLGTGWKTVRLRAEEAASLLLLGGEPFEEQLVMWWNFVGRSGEEIAEYAERWNAEDARFGAVVGYDGERLPAPVLPAMPLKPRGRVR